MDRSMSPFNCNSSSEAMLNLPEDMIIEILLRLALKSLLCCRSVSKLWLSLISHSRFAKSHFERSSMTSNRLMCIVASEARSLDFEDSFYDESSVLKLVSLLLHLTILRALVEGFCYYMISRACVFGTQLLVSPECCRLTVPYLLNFTFIWFWVWRFNRWLLGCRSFLWFCIPFCDFLPKIQFMERNWGNSFSLYRRCWGSFQARDNPEWDYALVASPSTSCINWSDSWLWFNIESFQGVANAW